MQTKYNMPYEVRQATLWIIRSYEERRKVCNKDYEDGGNIKKAAQPNNYKIVELIEHSYALALSDINNIEVRNELARAIMLNCVDGRNFPYAKLGLFSVTRTRFYQYKSKFVYEVAKGLNLLY